MPLKTYLTSKEIRGMIDLAPTLRDKVVISLLANTGCRVSELLSIKVDHLDFENNLVLISHLKHGIKKRCPKCNKQSGRSTAFCSHCGADLSKTTAEGIDEKKRLLNVGKDTMTLIADYIEKRENSKEEGFLIKITRQSINYLVRSLAERLGITKILNPETGKQHHVSPHIFRSSLAVSWLKYAGGDITKQKALQDHLGHQRFDTTMRYFKLAPVEVTKIGDEVRKSREAS